MAILSGLWKALDGDMRVSQISPSEIALSTGVRDFIDSVTHVDYMSPNQPMAPIAPTGTLPRSFDYPFGTNLYFQPRQEQPGSPDFNTLRQLSRYDIVRLCIETRKAQILEMPQQWRVAKEEGESDKSHEKRNKGDERIKLLNQFFRKPDKEHDFLDWMNMLVEEILVTDALSIWPVLNDDYETLALRLIDGSTIKPFIDPQGWRPDPPNPAYQQIIKGSPSIDMTAGLCEDCLNHKRHADGKGCMPLVYKPFNPTVNKLYGWSPVEQILNTILIGMNRMVSQQALYTEGNVPEMIISLSADMGGQQIAQFQAFFDELKGNVALKRRVRFIPEAKSVTQTKDPMIKDDRDDWLARVSCYALSVAPNALVKQMNRASSQQIQQSASLKAIANTSIITLCGLPSQVL